MYISAIKFIGAFPDGDKIVEISSPNGGGGGSYHLKIEQRVIGAYLQNHILHDFIACAPILA